MNNKGRMFLVALVWLVILGVGMMTWRLVFAPRVEKHKQQEQEQAKKAVLDNTSSESRYKHHLSLCLDSFSGYAVVRSDDFREECASRGIKVNLIDDGADYTKRWKALQSGEAQMAVFTIDALIKCSANLGDLPATIVAVIDETKGADAMVSSKVFPNIDAMNDPRTKIILTPDSPSETLARVVMAYFNLDRLSQQSFQPVNGVKEVYEVYRNSKPTDPNVYVLWEPYVSRMLANHDYKVLTDSSKFKGYIVDVIVVSRDFLIKNEETVRAVVESYFRACFSRRMVMKELVSEDSKNQGESLTPEQASRLVQTIQWRNTQENYAHFGFASGHGLQALDDMIANIINVLLKTKAIGADPTKGQPNLLYYDKVLRAMFDGNFHPGFGNEEVHEESKLAALSEEEWKHLVPVGTLQVPRLVFSRGTSRLTPASEEVLTQLAKDLKSWPQYYLSILGNCSKDGDVEANRRLATDRAQAAMEWLTRNGVDKRRVRAQSSEPNGSSTVAFVLGQVPF